MLETHAVEMVLILAIWAEGKNYPRGAELEEERKKKRPWRPVARGCGRPPLIVRIRPTPWARNTNLWACGLHQAIVDALDLWSLSGPTASLPVTLPRPTRSESRAAGTIKQARHDEGGRFLAFSKRSEFASGVTLVHPSPFRESSRAHHIAPCSLRQHRSNALLIPIPPHPPGAPHRQSPGPGCRPRPANGVAAQDGLIYIQPSLTGPGQ